MKNRIIALFIFFVTLSALPIYAKDEKIDRTPEPYQKDEFKTWQKDLRRFEIISFGAMPFVSLLSFWSYDIIRYVKHKKDPAYKPWPLKDPDIAVPLTEQEQKKIFGSIVGISIGIAIIDLSYRLIKRSIDRKKIEKIKGEGDDAIQLIPLDEAILNNEDSSVEKKNLYIPIQDGSKKEFNNSKESQDEEKN